MIEMKITANDVADLHEQIRAMLPDILPSTGPIIEKIIEDDSPVGTEGNVITGAATLHPTGNTANAAAEAGAGTNGLGLDKAKHPWDARIHSTAKSKNTDETWKIVRRPKRFDANPLEWKVYCQDVLTELSGGPVAIDPTVPITTPETENPEPQEDPAAVFGNNANVNPQTTTVTQMNTSSAPVDLSAFLLFMTSNADKITTDQVIAICQKYGVPELMVMYEPAFTNAIPLIFTEVQATINAHG